MKSPWLLIAAMLPSVAAIGAAAYCYTHHEYIAGSAFWLIIIITLPHWR